MLWPVTIMFLMVARVMRLNDEAGKTLRSITLKQPHLQSIGAVRDAVCAVMSSIVDVHIRRGVYMCTYTDVVHAC